MRQSADHEGAGQSADPRAIDLAAAWLDVPRKVDSVLGDARLFRLLAPSGTLRPLHRRARGEEEEENRQSGMWPYATRHGHDIAADTLNCI